MGKGDRFSSIRRKQAAIKTAEATGQIADSLEVRMALLDRMKNGEITLEQLRDELKRIKRGAKAAGMTTREQAYREG